MEKPIVRSSRGQRSKLPLNGVHQNGKEVNSSTLTAASFSNIDLGNSQKGTVVLNNNFEKCMQNKPNSDDERHKSEKRDWKLWPQVNAE